MRMILRLPSACSCICGLSLCLRIPPRLLRRRPWSRMSRRRLSCPRLPRVPPHPSVDRDMADVSRPPPVIPDATPGVPILTTIEPLLPATRSAGSLMLPPELEFEKDQVFHQFINHNREITELQHILRKAKMKRELWDIEHPTSPALSMSPATTSTTPLSASSVPPSSASVSSTPGVVTPDHDTADSKRKRHRSRSHRRGWRGFSRTRRLQARPHCLSAQARR